MDIFEMRGGHVFPTIELLGIREFGRVWEEDTSPEKGNAEKVFRYVNYMCKPVKSNIFYGIKNEELRAKAVKKEVWGDENYPTTFEMMQCCMKYLEMLPMSSPSLSTLDVAMHTVNKLEQFYTSADFTIKTPDGKGFLYKPKEVQQSLKELPATIRALEEARNKVHEELKSSAKTMNDREPGVYEE